jgi:hypothetical protein
MEVDRRGIGGFHTAEIRAGIGIVPVSKGKDPAQAGFLGRVAGCEGKDRIACLQRGKKGGDRARRGRGGQQHQPTPPVHARAHLPHIVGKLGIADCNPLGGDKRRTVAKAGQVIVIKEHITCFFTL